jgi:hypothetical protein
LPHVIGDKAEQAYASLITSSSAAAAAFIEFARVEAVSLLTTSAHIIRALAAELRTKRTMNGRAIDLCIEHAVAAKLIEDEKRRRRDWQQRQASAARFVAEKP